MKNEEKLIKEINKVIQDVRYGNFSSRLHPLVTPQYSGVVKDFNNMIESIEDREKMIKEYQSFILSQSENLIKLFNTMEDGIMTLSADFNILEVNSAQSKLFNINKKRLINKNIFRMLKKYKIKTIDANVISKQDKLEDILKPVGDYRIEIEYKLTIKTFHVSINRYMISPDNYNYLIVTKDISNEVELEKLRNTFIATLTHDLKVPILAEANVLRLFLEEKFGKISEQQSEALNNMNENNNEMINLVSTLLDVYKIEDGNFKLNKSIVNINALIDEEIDHVKYLTEKERKQVVFKKDGNMPDISADKDAIARVIRNILANAISFAPEGSEILITTKHRKDFVEFSITDSGNGIKKEDLELIFERFYSAGKKYRKVGTGLGLYLSKKIIDLHAGKIVVTSIPDVKTTFTVTLSVK